MLNSFALNLNHPETYHHHHVSRGFQKIGSRIKIFSNVAPQSTDRVIQILGTSQHLIATVQEILTLLKGTPVRGPVHLYDPINFDEVYADEYGGYGARGGGGAGQSGGHIRSGRDTAGVRGRDRFDRDDEHADGRPLK